MLCAAHATAHSRLLTLGVTVEVADQGLAYGPQPAVGGNGAYRGAGNGITGAPGGVNTGNGGGGSAKQTPNHPNANGAAGGSGFVILRYLTTDLDSMNLLATGGVLSTSGAYTIHTFTTDNTFALAIPEPSTFALSALGLLGMGCLGRRRRKRS